jgi:hypothetical protein
VSSGKLLGDFEGILQGAQLLKKGLGFSVLDLGLSGLSGLIGFIMFEI